MRPAIFKQIFFSLPGIFLAHLAVSQTTLTGPAEVCRGARASYRLNNPHWDANPVLIPRDIKWELPENWVIRGNPHPLEIEVEAHPGPEAEPKVSVYYTEVVEPTVSPDGVYTYDNDLISIALQTFYQSEIDRGTSTYIDPFGSYSFDDHLLPIDYQADPPKISINVSVKEPMGTLMFSVSESEMCPGNPYTFTVTHLNPSSQPSSLSGDFIWEIPEGYQINGITQSAHQTQGTSGSSVQITSDGEPGRIRVYKTFSNECPLDPVEIQVDVPGGPFHIVGPDAICESQQSSYVTFSVNTPSAPGYSWTVPEGWEVKGSKTGPSVEIISNQFGGELAVDINYGGCTITRKMNVASPSEMADFYLYGSIILDQVYGYTASVSDPAYTYVWSGPPGTRINGGGNEVSLSGADASKVLVEPTSEATEGPICLTIHNGCTFKTDCMPTYSFSSASAIKGPGLLCEDHSGAYAVTFPADADIATIPNFYFWYETFLWEIFNFQINGPENRRVLNLTPINALTDRHELNVNYEDNIVYGYTGSARISSDPVDYAITTLYTSEGDRLTSTYTDPFGSIVIDSLTGTSFFQPPHASKEIYVIPTSPELGGLLLNVSSQSACKGATVTATVNAYDFTLPGSDYIVWNVPNGWKINGQERTEAWIKVSDGGTSISVTAGSESGHISASVHNSKCHRLSAKQHVNVSNPKQVQLNVPGETCQGVEFQASGSFPYVTSYTWEAPAGWSVNNAGTQYTAQAATVTIRAGSNSGEVKLTGNNSCGSFSISKNVSVVPHISDPGTGQNVCPADADPSYLDQLCGEMVISGKTISTAESYTYKNDIKAYDITLLSEGNVTITYGNSIELTDIVAESGEFTVEYDPSLDCDPDPPARVSASEEFKGDPEAQVAEGFEVFPNPTTGKIHLDFTISPDRMRKISIYNFSGTEVRVLDKGETETSLEGLGPGIYLFRVETEDKILTKKVILLK